MELLAIDQGNTTTKFGYFRAGELQRTWIVPTDKGATAEVLAMQLMANDVSSPLALGLSTVTAELLPAWRRMAVESGYSITIINGLTPAPLRNEYLSPDTLGADRFMAAVAAAHYVGLPVISISLGTAIVVDAVSTSGAYLGGIIAPGIAASTNALHHIASALPAGHWAPPTRAIARNTAEALSNGLFYQSVGGLNAMVRAIRDELGVSAPLALHGGWAHLLAPHLEGVALVDEHLVLRGIYLALSQLG